MRIVLLILIGLSGSCVPPPVQSPPPDQPVRYTVPLGARNGDLICAETLAKLPDYCRRVDQFRLWMMGQAAD